MDGDGRLDPKPHEQGASLGIRGRDGVLMGAGIAMFVLAIAVGVNAFVGFNSQPEKYAPGRAGGGAEGRYIFRWFWTVASCVFVILGLVFAFQAIV